MFTQFTNSWNIVKQSARVLAADKELLIFPILSSLGVIIVTASFVIPLFMANFFDSIFKGGGEILGLFTLFLFYLCQYFVIFFANTALVGATLIRLKGGDPTVKDGFNIAFSRFGSILGYALIAATVGMIIKALSRKKSGLQHLLISLVGFAWNVATFLVVPVLAAEGVGPIKAIKRSAELLKKTWGEQLIGNFGINSVFTIITILILVVTLPIIFLFFINQLTGFSILLGCILIFLLLLIGLVNSTLNGIYAAAIYQYADTGQMGSYFDQEIVRNAFTSR